MYCTSRVINSDSWDTVFGKNTELGFPKHMAGQDVHDHNMRRHEGCPQCKVDVLKGKHNGPKSPTEIVILREIAVRTNWRYFAARITYRWYICPSCNSDLEKAGMYLPSIIAWIPHRMSRCWIEFFANLQDIARKIKVSWTRGTMKSSTR